MSGMKASQETVNCTPLPMTSQATAMTIKRLPGMMVPAMVPTLEMRPEAFMPKKLTKVAPQ